MRNKILILGIVLAGAAIAASTYISKPVVCHEIKPAMEKKFYVLSRQGKSISPSDLQKAEKLSDFIEYYPSSWITDYDSVVVFTTSNGWQKKAEGKDEVLTQKQKDILSTADMFSKVSVLVKHKSVNSITQEVEDEEMILELRVSPEVQAEYPDGIEGLQNYLRESSKAEVLKVAEDIGFVAIVYFTINEEGKPEDIEISESTEYKGVDAHILKSLEAMPAWKPAQDAQGNKIKQKFEFTFGYGSEEGC